MSKLLSELFNTPGYSNYAVGMYYLGAFFWLLTYAMVIYKIVKHKFLEFPAIVIAANVPWEFLWGFVFNLSFGGALLQWSWRAGMLMDAFMLITAFRYGASQVDSPGMKKWMPAIIAFVFFFMMGLLYFYQTCGYDLPMGFNSGMLLNFCMSVLCILYMLRRPNAKFSIAIAVSKLLATDLFFTLYIYDVDPTAYFSIYLCWVCVLVDLLYVILCIRHNRRQKMNPSIATTS